MNSVFARLQVVVVVLVLVSGMMFSVSSAEVEKQKSSKAERPAALTQDAVQGGDAIAPSGWMGSRDGIRFDEAWVEEPHSGDTCIKVNVNTCGRWGAILWENPDDQRRNKPAGFDLTGVQTLTFWARGEEASTWAHRRSGWRI